MNLALDPPWSGSWISREVEASPKQRQPECAKLWFSVTFREDEKHSCPDCGVDLVRVDTKDE